MLSGREALPPEEEMLRAAREDSSAREAAGVPAYRTHAIPAVDRYEYLEFVYRHSDLPRMEERKVELFETSFTNAMDDRDDGEYSESIRDGLRRWRRVAGAQYAAALAAAASGDRARADADAEAPLPAPCQLSQL